MVSFRDLGVRWTAALTHRPILLGGDKTAEALSRLFEDRGRTERARGSFIQKACAEHTGLPQQARTKATAWASKTECSFPQGRTSLGELGMRTEPGHLTVIPRRLRGEPEQQERAEMRRALRGGVDPESPVEERPPEEGPAPDVEMEEEAAPDPAPPAADPRPGAGSDTSGWSGAQVIAKSSRLLLSGLDEEEGDNPDPAERTWEEEEEAKPTPEGEEQPSDAELAETAGREWQWWCGRAISDRIRRSPGLYLAATN